MSNDTFSPMAKKSFVTAAIFIGLNALGLLFFQSLIEVTYGVRILDPEMTSLIGISYLVYVYLLFSGLKSHSAATTTLIAKAVLLGAILSIGAQIYFYITTSEYPERTYLGTGGANAVVAILMLFALKCGKK